MATISKDLVDAVISKVIEVRIVDRSLWGCMYNQYVVRVKAATVRKEFSASHVIIATVQSSDYRAIPGAGLFQWAFVGEVKGQLHKGESKMPRPKNKTIEQSATCTHYIDWVI